MKQPDNTHNPALLGTEKIGRLLWQYSIPAIVGTLVNAGYNIMDRIFIGQGVGSMAISGLAITFPVIMLAGGFGLLIGAGGAALVSIRLGEKNIQKAEKILANCMILNVIISVLFTTFSLMYLDKILVLFGGSEATMPYAREFLEIILSGMIVTSLLLSMNNIMRASGHPKKAMITLLIGAACNMVLDPLFIFGFHWGIRGAAIATVISQVVSAVWVVAHFFDKRNFLHFRKEQFVLDRRIIGGILAIGSAPFLLLSAASVVQAIMNNGLHKYGGDVSIGAFGIYNSVLALFVFFVLGLTQGMQPIAGYNYGAKQFSRLKDLFKRTVLIATAITSLGFLVGMLFPGAIARMFTTDEEMIAIAAHGLRITVLLFPFVGFQIVTSNLFMSTGKAPIAILLTLSRQVLFLIPALLILPGWFGLDGVFMAAPISDTIAVLITSTVLAVQLKKFK